MVERKKGLEDMLYTYTDGRCNAIDVEHCIKAFDALRREYRFLHPARRRAGQE
jgi:hypothetical protein